jgi:hypothetical protein
MKRVVGSRPSGLLRMGAVFLLVGLLGGCAKTTATSLVTGQPGEAGRNFGKTVVLTYASFEEADVKGRDKAARLRQMIEARFRGLPGMTPTDAEALTSALGARNWRDAGDMELVAAARATGVDSVAVVEVGSCFGELAIALPPAWSVNTHFSYRVRMLDARTGKLVLSALRGRDTGGAFSLRGSESLYKDFDADLAALLFPVSASAHL